MDQWKDTVANIAIVSTIGLFSSGILTCRKIIQNRSVGVVPYLPFIAASINCSLWLAYAVIVSDSSIIVVNTVGLILQLLYLIVYSYYTDNKYILYRDGTIAASIVTVVVVMYSLVVDDHSTRVTHLGIICNFFTICFFASPLSTMATVIKTQSTESMSLPLSVMSSLTTSSWTVYGFIIKDYYVQFPNFIGFLLSLVQLSLFCFYASKNKVLTIESPA